MTYEESRDRFIQIWGTVGVEWGINRTMAQVHALLLATPSSLSTDEVMERLSISRGNANMTLRELVNWGLVYRESRPGDRKDYFNAEKDIWEVAQRIVAERRKRELTPMMKMLEQLMADTASSKKSSTQAKHLSKLVGDIHELGKRSQTLLDLVVRFDQSTFFRPLKALFRKAV